MKTVNDTYGHSEGDKSLTATASILRNTFRESDVIARLGGDEFVVMITGADERNSCTMMDRLQKNLDLHNTAAETRHGLSLSAGMVYCDPGEKPCSLEDLLKMADELMCESKRGKAHYCDACKIGTSAI